MVGERVRAAFEKAGVEISGHRIGCTVSIGVAEAGPPLAEFGELIGRADAALYRAKHGGRNRVVMDDPSAAPGLPAKAEAAA